MNIEVALVIMLNAHKRITPDTMATKNVVLPYHKINNPLENLIYAIYYILKADFA